MTHRVGRNYCAFSFIITPHAIKKLLQSQCLSLQAYSTDGTVTADRWWSRMFLGSSVFSSTPSVVSKSSGNMRGALTHTHTHTHTHTDTHRHTHTQTHTHTHTHTHTQTHCMLSCALCTAIISLLHTIALLCSEYSGGRR